MCHSKSMKRWAVAFSPAGPRNYRLCFKVDCVPIMYARRGERRRGRTRQRETREGRTKGWLCSGRRWNGGRRRGERETGTPLKYGSSNWLRHIEFGSMGSRAHRLLELRHIIRRSFVEGASSFGNFVMGFLREQNPSGPKVYHPAASACGAIYKSDARVSIRLINRTLFHPWKCQRKNSLSCEENCLSGNSRKNYCVAFGY